jgi:hypothetical protein
MPPEEFVAAGHEVAQAMEDLGFRVAGCLRVSKSAPRSTLFVTLFEHAATRQTAGLYTNVVESSAARQTFTYLVFRTEFTDDTTLTTSNARVSPPVPRGRLWKGSASFPEIRSPRRLYEIHQASVA